MKKYCRTYFKVYGIFNIEEFLSTINVKPDKVIDNNDGNIELHFGYNENYNGDLEPMYYDTIKYLIPYTDILVSWREKGVSFKLMVETNRNDIENCVIVRFDISCFVYYTRAYNDDYPIF